MIDQFTESQIDDFMFIWYIEDDENVDKQILLQKIKSIGNDIEVLADNMRIVITNKQCKISGYYESYPFEFDEILS